MKQDTLKDRKLTNCEQLRLFAQVAGYPAEKRLKW